MKKWLLFLMVPYASHAVEVQTVWGQLPQSITKTSLSTQLQRVKENNGHIRYQLTHKGLPIWGYQLINHKKNQIPFSGYLISGLDKEIPSTDSKLSQEEILKQFVTKNAKLSSIKKIIYIDHNKAKLAYHLSYYTKQNDKPTQPNKIIDANTGAVLKAFDSLHKQRIGQGPGGNYVRLPTRAGDFHYGIGTSNANTLGRFDVTVSQGFCTVANKNFEVVNLQNIAFDWDLFPIDEVTASRYKPFSYSCNKQSQYINADDGGYAPIHDGLSPVNDSMYFSQATLDMYQQLYGDDKPFGDDLPIRIYTHIANLDNAFAMETEYQAGKLVAHQQVVIGNGEYMFAPMSQTTIPHELSHNVTSNYSGLVYDGQSGGINEAFSDMTDLALRDYLSRQYPWYWKGDDWSIGREEVLSGDPLRYMEKPSSDGYSIDTAKDYYDGIDVHLSSGVFNRAFYLLAHQPGWNAEKTFQVMFDANRYYWMPNTNFDFAACGVIQAAKDRMWPADSVIVAFEQVGVKCPLV